jgi:tetratricopeptide (TPR) repeat protein
VTPKVWSQAIETALGGNAGHGTRVAAAERALATARAQGWNDNRLAFSHFALARLYVAIDPLRAVKEFTAAARLYRSLPGGHIHVAHIDMQLAAIAVAKGQPNEAIQFANRALPVIERAQNAALLATVMLIKAEAYDLLGQSQQADALRLDSGAWARYGFGSDAATQSRMREISALGSRGRRS